MNARRKSTRSPSDGDVYTYRGGEKLPLNKRPDAFVVRTAAPPAESFDARSMTRASPASTRVRVRPEELEARMADSRMIAPTHHAYELADTSSEFLITDRVLVRFKPETSLTQIDELAARYSLIALDRFSELEFLFQLTDHTGMNPVKLVVALTEDEGVVDIAENDLNQRMMRKQFTPPTDTHYLRSWHLHERYTHADFDPRSSSRCEHAWQLLNGYGSPDVVIAVTDDGCRLDHGDFNQDKFATWAYFKGTRLVTSTDADAVAANMYQTGANHGTSCAGVAAGEADGVLTVGAAPGCRLLPVKWESDDDSLYVSDSKLRRVLDWIADKADVMSNSWGSVPDNLFATVVVDRIRELSTSGGRRGRGIVFLWAAGNEDCPIEYDGTVQIPYTDGWEYHPTSGTYQWVGVSTSHRFRNTLVSLPGVIHVAALASTARRSHYSNYGTGVDLCAPSSNSHAFSRMSVAGLGIVAATGQGQRYSVAFGGTSSATPLVAGIAGLVISANPLLHASEVISILQRTASKDVDSTDYPRTPAAAYDPQPSWDVSPVGPFAQAAFVARGDADGTWSPWFGFGRVDAQRAVAEAISRRAPAPVTTPASGYTARSNRVIDIPDSDASGIEDRLSPMGTGEVGSLELQVDIEHPYIGDLVVSLTTPDGRVALVHDRNGGNRQNLTRSWTLADTPALAALIGATIAGDWRLRVRDVASVDIGKLRNWSLAVGPRPASRVVLSESPGLAIPDNRAPGLIRTLQCNADGRIADLAVDIDITHTYVGDLSITLSTPAGQRIVLHNREGGNSDNLIRSWSTSTASLLSSLVGEAAKGAWTLEIADREALDVGKLNSWTIALTVAPLP